MLQQEIETIYSWMLAGIDSINSDIYGKNTNLELSLACIEQAIGKLYQQIDVSNFNSAQEEIYFFKVTKPRFLCWHIYVIELNHLLFALPIDTDEILEKFYRDELHAVERFFKRHAFLYQYYAEGDCSKDEILFLRKNITNFPLGQELMGASDRKFATSMDYMFAKFRAMEMYRDYVIARMNRMSQKYENAVLEKILKRNNMSWCGEKTELVELIYGIYYTGRINFGKAELSDIIAWFEESFDIDLAQAYRIFFDIKRRKNTSYTKFIDEMQQAIVKNITDVKYNHS